MNSTAIDMLAAIAPKSDQINADDLLSGPMTITIAGVKIASTEQPVSMSFQGSTKFFRPCKSMCRVIVAGWGPDSAKYAGRSLTLYCDPSVKWGGMAVGGIRISHMSHIDKPLNMMLTATKGSRKAYVVQPLVVDTQTATQAPTRKQLHDEIMLVAEGLGMPDGAISERYKAANYANVKDIPIEFLTELLAELRAI